MVHLNADTPLYTPGYVHFDIQLYMPLAHACKFCYKAGPYALQLNCSNIYFVRRQQPQLLQLHSSLSVNDPTTTYIQKGQSCLRCVLQG